MAGSYCTFWGKVQILLLIGGMGLVWPIAGGAGTTGQTTPPKDMGLVEKVEVQRILIDVTAVDASGNPLRGLKAEDFQVSANGRTWTVRSADDFCSCETQPPALPPPSSLPDTRGSSPAVGSSAGLLTAQATPGAPGNPSEFLSGKRPRFVLYFDFNQMRMDGRYRALEVARRWVQHSFQPGDEAMVVALFGLYELKEFQSFTSNPQLILAAIDAAATDPIGHDPYPDLRESRLRECLQCKGSVCGLIPKGVKTRNHSSSGECCAECRQFAREESRREGRSLRNLALLLDSIEKIPGRKAILYFQQNGLLFPNEIYGVSNLTAADHVQTIEEVGASATQSRAAIYTAYTGGMEMLFKNEAVNVGANLADMTGGGYNRGPQDLDELLDQAGRECRCFYRLALEPRPGPSGRVYQLWVKVRGQDLPGIPRVTLFSPDDQWKREARSALLRPAVHRDLSLDAALVPLDVDHQEWTVALEVALDLSSLAPIPTASGVRAEWGIGVFLRQEDGGETWAFEQFSAVLIKNQKELKPVALHRRVLTLPPGRYQLRAFAGDVQGKAFGGADAHLELPDPHQGGLSTPVLRRSGHSHLLLPLSPEGEHTSSAGDPVVEKGFEPVGGHSLFAGQTVEAVSFLCPSKTESPSPGPWRFLAFEQKPAFRFPDSPRQHTGPCFRIVDTFNQPQLPLAPGAYSYHLREPQTQNERSSSFTVVSSPLNP